MTNLAPKITDILNDKTLDVLVYSGDKDFICNWRGGEAWTLGCDWDGKKDYDRAQYQQWKVNDEVAGELKTYENLKFLRVHEAGHMVPMNQPVAALQMLNEFTSGGVYVNATERFIYSPNEDNEDKKDDEQIPLQW